MNLIKLFMAICGCLLLMACGAKSDAKKAVLSQLKDPESAKFGKFTQVDDKHGCFGVNAHNSMGGYSGEQQATLIKGNEGWLVFNFSEISHEKCVGDIKDILHHETVMTTAYAQVAEIKREWKELFVASNANTSIKSKSNRGPKWVEDANIAGKEMKWEEAMTWTKNFNYAGKTDWRLPSKEEWESLTAVIDLKALSENVFKNVATTNDSCYWSSSVDEASNNSAWAMVAGKTILKSKDTSCKVWPAHTEQ